ncbi:MAG: M48 family metallopeptidase [Patescibacteria group bacterium]
MRTPVTTEVKIEFKARVRAWAVRIRVEPKQVRVQAMRRKWASCSKRGWCTFAHDLLHESRPFQDHVIVHELLHLRYRNHGKLYRAALRSYLSPAKAMHLDVVGDRCLVRRES